MEYLEKYHPEAEKVDFIIERKAQVTRHIQDFHSQLAQALEAQGAASLARLVGELIPGGKERVPLQAADVLCWHSARSQQVGTMDAADKRRYAKLAHRSGCLSHLTNEQISQMEAALLR